MLLALLFISRLSGKEHSPGSLFLWLHGATGRPLPRAAFRLSSSLPLHRTIPHNGNGRARLIYLELARHFFQPPVPVPHFIPAAFQFPELAATQPPFHVPFIQLARLRPRILPQGLVKLDSRYQPAGGSPPGPPGSCKASSTCCNPPPPGCISKRRTGSVPSSLPDPD